MPEKQPEQAHPHVHQPLHDQASDHVSDHVHTHPHGHHPAPALVRPALRARSVLAWPAWQRVLAVLPVVVALWLGVWWANLGAGVSAW